MVIQDKRAVYVQMDFTRNGMVANLYVQVSLICINFFGFIAVSSIYYIDQEQTFLKILDISGTCRLLHLDMRYFH